MNITLEAVDQARNDARSLYKQIHESTSKSHAAIRGDLQDAATQAQRLASSLKTLGSDQRADASGHLGHAASLLEAAAEDARTIAKANAADVRDANLAMLEHTRDAVQDISQAIAAKRAAARRKV